MGRVGQGMLHALVAVLGVFAAGCPQVLRDRVGETTDASTCFDEAKNGSESDVDCGGSSCLPCADDKTCGVASDCASGVCNGSVCLAPTCVDEVKNGGESYVNCGGPCAPCGDGRPCGFASDCASGVCQGSVCVVPTCFDMVKNGSESDMNCGGSCAPCGDRQACGVASDCVSAVCKGGFCVAPTCSDEVKNGSESDMNCGGSCASCGDGQACGVASDCASGVCEGSVCLAPTCVDMVKNGSESDMNCGGSCAPCGDGRVCGVASDCASGVCQGGLCVASTCVDDVQNGSESDVDCGVACAPCDNGDECGIALDCASGVCVGTLCQAPTCFDDVENGAETDLDCGGGACPGCLDGQACALMSDCQSAICANGTCGPKCDDGQKDGAETDVDCGGGAACGPGSCDRCGNGKACVQDSDCSSSHCASGLCAPWVASSAARDRVVGIAIDADGTIFTVGSELIAHGPDGTQPVPAVPGISPEAVAVDPNDGSVVLADIYNTSPSCADNKAPSVAGNGILVEKRSGGPQGGSCLWARGFGGALGKVDFPESVAIDAAGNVYVAGSFSSNPLDLTGIGGLALPNQGGYDGFVVALHADGSFWWAKAFGGMAGDGGAALAALGTDVVVTGAFNGGPVDFGEGPGGEPHTLSIATGQSAFLARFSAPPEGPVHTVWANQYGSPGDSAHGDAVAVDADDNILLAMGYSASFSFEMGGPAMPVHGGAPQVAVAKLDAGGQSVWSKGFGGTGNTAAYSIAFDTANNPLVAGFFDGSFVPGPLAQLTSAGARDAFVIELDASGCDLASAKGCVLAAHAFGGSSDDEAIAVAVDPCRGDVLLGGHFQSAAIDFGGVSIPNGAAGNYQEFLVGLGSLP